MFLSFKKILEGKEEEKSREKTNLVEEKQDKIAKGNCKPKFSNLDEVDVAAGKRGSVKLVI